jgi:phosphodiesterase/alkaline phosphatase D-like protein
VDGVTITARLRGDASTAQLRVESASSSVVTDAVASDEYSIVRFDVGGLDPGTAYTYRVVVEGEPDAGRGHGVFDTPVAGPMSFTVTAGACARTGSNGAVFDAIRSEDPLLHLITGDLHYEDLAGSSPRPYLDAYNRALTTPAQAALARAVPMAYVWDDHDYGSNDSDASSPGRSAAREAYRRAVPDAGVEPGDRPINQAFSIGRVRFVLTDTRSARTDETILGEDQLDWFLDELTTASTTHAVVIWVSSVPWIGEASPGADAWYGVPDERARIADAIAEAGITNLVMIAGDAHMVAIDDGSNSDYSTNGGAGFPVLHAAALDRPGSMKGGPYSEGAFPGSGQYGRIDVEDEGGDSVTVRLSGLDYEGNTIVEYEHTVAVS